MKKALQEVALTSVNEISKVDFGTVPSSGLFGSDVRIALPVASLNIR
jgi:hypothetical protein